MSIAEYIESLQRLLAETPFTISTTFFYDERPPSACLIKSCLTFVDGSQLDVREFVVFKPLPDVIAYAYNYRSSDRLIFRYDNASDPAAKNVPTYPHHKHDPSGIHAATQPSLASVLGEITSRMRIG